MEKTHHHQSSMGTTKTNLLQTSAFFNKFEREEGQRCKGLQFLAQELRNNTEEPPEKHDAA
jgi:hypothetical protein